MKTNIIKLIFLLFTLPFFVKGQPINVSNIVTTGHFSTCSGGLPVITAIVVPGNGAIVINDTLYCINPNDSSTINVTLNNILWDKNPGNNWLHGVFFSANGGTKIASNSLAPPSWTFMASGCTGQCPNQTSIVGGSGYYFAGPGSSCCFDGGATTYPCDNYGDALKSCATAFSLSYQIRIKNSSIVNNLVFRIRGSSDGATGCWATTEIVTSNTIDFRIASVRCNTNSTLCNPIGSAVFTTNLPAPYQWQHSTDSIQFNNIVDNANYTGTNSQVLSLSNISSNRYGEQFRCVANGINGQVFTLIYKNTWTGAINSDWATPGNWSCGTVPDGNTDAFINFGNVIVSTNNVVRSVTVKNPGTLTVNTGATLTVLH